MGARRIGRKVVGKAKKALADKKKKKKLLKDAGGVGNTWNGFIVGVPVTIQDEAGKYLVGGAYTAEGVSTIGTSETMCQSAIWMTSFGRGAGLTAKTKGFTDTLAGIQIYNTAERLTKEATAPQDDHWVDNEGRWYVSACGDAMTQWGNTAANVKYADGTLTQEGCTKQLTITMQTFGTQGADDSECGIEGGDGGGGGEISGEPGPGCMIVDGAATIDGVPQCDVAPAVPDGATGICSCGGLGLTQTSAIKPKGKKDRKKGGKKDRKKGGK